MWHLADMPARRRSCRCQPTSGHRTSRTAKFASCRFLGQQPLKHHSYGDGQYHGYQAVSQCTFIRASSQGNRPAHSTHDDLPDPTLTGRRLRPGFSRQSDNSVLTLSSSRRLKVASGLARLSDVFSWQQTVGFRTSALRSLFGTKRTLLTPPSSGNLGAC